MLALQRSINPSYAALRGIMAPLGIIVDALRPPLRVWLASAVHAPRAAGCEAVVTEGGRAVAAAEALVQAGVGGAAACVFDELCEAGVAFGGVILSEGVGEDAAG